MEKYTLVKEGNLYRLVARRNFNGVRPGQRGGLVEGHHNLSHDGNCWVHFHATVTDDATVLDDATVAGTSKLSQEAQVSKDAYIEDSTMSGKAHVTGDAAVRMSHLYDHARVDDFATVIDSVLSNTSSATGGAYVHCSKLFDYASVTDHAEILNSTLKNNAIVQNHGSIKKSTLLDSVTVQGNAMVRDNSKISGHTNVEGNAHVYDSTICSGDSSVISGTANIKDTLIELDSFYISAGAYIKKSKIIGVYADILGSVKNSYINMDFEDLDIPSNVKLDKATVVAPTDFFVAGPLGSRNDYVTFYKGHYKETRVSTGCFSGTLTTFKERVAAHGDELAKREYEQIMKVVDEICL